MKRSGGYTFVEVTMAILLIGIIYVPLMESFAVGLRQMRLATAHQTAVDLAVEDLQKLELEGVTAAALRQAGSTEQDPLEMNRIVWVVRRTCVAGSQPLEVHVQVFRRDELERPEYEIVTFLADEVL